MQEKTKKMHQQLIEESEYIKRVKKELEDDKKQEKDRKLKKAKDAALVLEENAKAEEIREKKRQEQHQEDLRVI